MHNSDPSPQKQSESGWKTTKQNLDPTSQGSGSSAPTMAGIWIRAPSMAGIRVRSLTMAGYWIWAPSMAGIRFRALTIAGYWYWIWAPSMAGIWRLDNEIRGIRIPDTGFIVGIWPRAQLTMAGTWKVDNKIWGIRIRASCSVLLENKKNRNNL